MDAPLSTITTVTSEYISASFRAPLHIMPSPDATPTGMTPTFGHVYVLCSYNPSLC